MKGAMVGSRSHNRSLFDLPRRLRASTAVVASVLLLSSTVVAPWIPGNGVARAQSRRVRRAHREAAAASPVAALPAFLRGQTHVHTSRSYDGRTSPAQVLTWYADHGYDFVVFTDHNKVTLPRALPGREILPIAGVELSQNFGYCVPRLPGSARCLLHVNSLFVDGGERDAFFPRAHTHERDALYARAIDRTTELGGLAQINHPNFYFSADADAVRTAAAHGARFLEVDNWVIDGLPGDHPTRPSVEAMWDAALTAGHTLYGVATDDAHVFGGPRRPRSTLAARETPGHGWVMVRAARDPRAIRDAMAAGQFYASTGVRLALADPLEGALRVRVADDSPPGAYVIRFVGMHGRELERVEGREAHYALARLAPGEYVRAVVEGPRRSYAWVQPVRATR